MLTHPLTHDRKKKKTLPLLVKNAVSFNLDPRLRSRSGTVVTHLHTYSHIKSKTSAEMMTGRKDKRLDRIDEVKRKMDWQIDDNTLNLKLKETNVLLKTDFQSWNWDLIGELIEGPLANPVHFASASRQKFLKRIFSFLRPQNRSYSALPWTRV